MTHFGLTWEAFGCFDSSEVVLEQTCSCALTAAQAAFGVTVP